MTGEVFASLSSESIFFLSLFFYDFINRTSVVANSLAKAINTHCSRYLLLTKSNCLLK